MEKKSDKSTEYAQLLTLLQTAGIEDEAVLEAMAMTPRHLFVPEALEKRAYENTALPVGAGQTISQPYIVALMTRAVCCGERLKTVLEIGTGTGYQAAILSHLADQVYTVERLSELAVEAQKRLKKLKITNVKVKLADGFDGWQEYAPFQGIIVTAAPLSIPKQLLSQLADGGRMVIPVGEKGNQRLLRITRNLDRFSEEVLEWVQFVPLLPGTL